MTPPGSIVTRFAPSPSGELHLGHAYAAIVAHDTARARPGGRFILRIDDIDPGRSRPEHVDAILADLAWLGLAWDGDPVFQSDRLDSYAAALDTLRSGGFAYPCFCTRADIAAEIAASDVAPHGPAASRYPGTCRAIPAAEAMARCAAEPHCWRLDTARAADSVGPLDWHEDGVGTIAADPLAAGDIVLARKDAPASYHLANVVDDAALGVTCVVRGSDLADATHVQRLLQALLGLPTPDYRHHALVVGSDGKRLAKRDHAAGLATLRQGGIDGARLATDLRAHRFPTGYSLANA
ncbi:tRNA glutamyl-Q(34) synthetase GluQRS [Sphingorhabdus soli]|uniref:tRNA glutamyl-Q(34) synthetase GluQRS n=2 Tax=Flavisphingopyxis soli TaxID=2601267 RepID=A0A5C6UUN1_9SPHN|nr:tRNA glutamyl-Q(34) synthetase GluQRS [Sphingorhabdus soli]